MRKTSIRTRKMRGDVSWFEGLAIGSLPQRSRCPRLQVWHSAPANRNAALVAIAKRDLRRAMADHEGSRTWPPLGRLLRSRNCSRCMVSLPAPTWPLAGWRRPPSRSLTKPPASRTRIMPGGDVPRRQIALPVGIEPAGGDKGEVERGGAEAAQAGEMLLRGENFLAAPSKDRRGRNAAARRRPRPRRGVGARRRASAGR